MVVSGAWDRLVAVGVALLVALLALPCAQASEGAGDGPRVRTLKIDGMIHGVTAAIISRAIDGAAQSGAVALLIELDTPGGLVDSTEDIVRSILNAPIPVVVWVGPRGAHAASAGFFILLAADVAAMAPVTRTGASSVITMGGENKEGDIALKKASEDLSALIRSAARARNRPAELAEKAVREAKSWSAEEALEARLVDFVAESPADLLKKLDGREVRRPDGTPVRLALAGARLEEHRLEWLEGFKKVVLHPTIMALLLSLAVLGIYVEFTHPGLIFPGVVGAAALLVFLYGSRVLPVRYFGAALVVLGVLMFILEIKVVSYGLLSVGGTIAVGLGLWLLFPGDVPGLRVPMGTLLPLVLFLALCLGGVTWLVARTARLAPTTGREGIVGEIGEATTDLLPLGQVFVHGETWRARAARPLAAGTRVRVVSSEGLTLVVEPVSDEGSDGGPAA